MISLSALFLSCNNDVLFHCREIEFNKIDGKVDRRSFDCKVQKVNGFPQ